MFKILTCILFYFPCSIGLTFYQQWFVRQFHFPLFIVLIHYVIKFGIALTFRHFYAVVHKKERTTLKWADIFSKVAIVGVAASLDIGLSNWSFQYITISLYTMCKSSAIIFILFFTFVLSLERFKLSSIFIVTLISIGLFLFTFKSTQFDWFGFLLVEAAAFCSGIRWATSQLIMQRKEIGLENPIDLMYYVQPWMILTAVPLIFAIEGTQIFTFKSAYTFWHTVTLIIVGGLIGFLMEFAEYLLVYYTSGVTLNVCGIVKEILTLTIAHFFKGDLLSLVNFGGLLICMAGIILYVALKSRSENSKFHPNYAHHYHHGNLKYKNSSPTTDMDEPLINNNSSNNNNSDQNLAQGQKFSNDSSEEIDL